MEQNNEKDEKDEKKEAEPSGFATKVALNFARGALNGALNITREFLCEKGFYLDVSTFLLKQFVQILTDDFFNPPVSDDESTGNE